MSTEKQTDKPTGTGASTLRTGGPSHAVADTFALVKAGSVWGVWSRKTRTFTDLSQVTVDEHSYKPFALVQLQHQLVKYPEAASLADRMLTAVCASKGMSRLLANGEDVELLKPLLSAAAKEPSFEECSDVGSLLDALDPAPVRWLSVTATHQLDPTCLTHPAIDEADLLPYDHPQEGLNTANLATSASVGATAATV